LTGVVEETIRVFYLNWTGTGSIENAGGGDSERLVIQERQYMISEVVDTEGVMNVEILLNVYGAGDTLPLLYRTGNSVVNCQSASWNLYPGTPVTSQGFIQLKISAEPEYMG
jgi:hypothetical protein